MGGQSPFTVRTTVRHGVANVALHGELDAETVPTLQDDLVHLERTDVEAIVLDLHELTLLGSSGLHAFCTARDHAEANGHLFILIGVSERQRRLFDITQTQFLLEDGAAADVIGRFKGQGASQPEEVRGSDVEADV